MRIFLTWLLLSVFCVMLSMQPVLGWSNGGYSSDPSHPDYGTHDWIAQHALDWLPAQEKQYIQANLAAYLYGTELPDNSQASDGIGDTVRHHVYYWSNGKLQDDAAALRAFDEFQIALNLLEAGDYTNASKTAGIMSHYIVDVAVFGHVMGASTDWGNEKHHSDYEDYVLTRTSSYTAEFNHFLSFNGSLSLISAYNAALSIAYDTTFDAGGSLTCVWMDNNYNWSNPIFANRAGESLNLAVNYLADVLHTLYVDAEPNATSPPSTPSPSSPPSSSPSPSPSPSTSPSPSSSPSLSSQPTQSTSPSASPSLPAWTAPSLSPSSTSSPSLLLSQPPSPSPSQSQNPTNSPSPTIPEMTPSAAIIALAIATCAIAVAIKKKPRKNSLNNKRALCF